jgi:hypothetical protein
VIERRGFAMITTLWVMTVASVIALAGALTGRSAVNATRHRTQLERGFWIASGCASRIRAAIDNALAESETFEAAGRMWRVLNRIVLPITLPGGDTCEVGLEAAGTRLDLNAATPDMLDSLFNALGLGEGAATTLSSAVLTWRGTHDPFVDGRQLLDIGGFEDFARFDSVLWAEPGRVSLATARLAVLMTVPGITRETAERFVEMQDAGTPVSDPVAIMGTLSHTSADAMMAHYPEIVRLTTPDPEAWILTVTAPVGSPASRATVEWRLVRTGRRCVVVRTRSNL